MANNLFMRDPIHFLYGQFYEDSEPPICPKIKQNLGTIQGLFSVKSLNTKNEKYTNIENFYRLINEQN